MAYISGKKPAITPIVWTEPAQSAPTQPAPAAAAPAAAPVAAHPPLMQQPQPRRYMSRGTKVTLPGLYGISSMSSYFKGI